MFWMWYGVKQRHNKHWDSTLVRVTAAAVTGFAAIKVMLSAVKK